MKNIFNLLILTALLLSSAYELQAATEQYCLSYRDDPATTIVIGWGGDNGTVHYGTTDEGNNYANYPSSHASDRTGNAHGHNRHFARLTGLTPNTMYYFVIHDANGVTSNRFKFKTLSDDPNDPVSFINGGDTRDGFKVFGIYTEDCPSGNCLDMRRAGNDLVALIRPDFIAFNGDYVQNQITSDTEAEWNTWLADWQRTISTDGRMYPIMHSRGNHEDASDTYELFDIPQEEYYALDFHGGLIRYYSLNSELDACNGTNQLNWLTNDLQNSTGGSNDPVWKIAQYHSPTYAMGKDGNLIPNQMDCWVNLFEQYTVSLVSESDSHSSKWSWPCKANAAGDDFELDNNGIVYIGEGQWGAPHRDLVFTGGSQKPYIRDQDVFDNFFFIRVSKDSITIQSVKFENIPGVTASTDDNLGHGLPAGTTLWTPSNGDMIVIAHPSADVLEVEAKVNAIFPNPASNQVNIEFKESMNNGTLELYNSLGKLCKSESINGNTHTLDIQDACSGVSYIYIKSEDGTIESYKIIKQ